MPSLLFAPWFVSAADFLHSPYIIYHKASTRPLRYAWTRMMLRQYANLRQQFHVFTSQLQNALFYSFILGDSSHHGNTKQQGFWKWMFHSVVLCPSTYYQDNMILKYPVINSWLYFLCGNCKAALVSWCPEFVSRQARIYNRCRLSRIDCNWLTFNLSSWNRFNPDI